MSKPEDDTMTNNNTIKTIMSRRSVRAYKPYPIPQEILQAIIEAGQAVPYVSPDSRRFTVIQDRAVIDRLNQSAYFISC